MSSSDNPLAVTMDGNRSITATFTQDQYTLDAPTVGNGSVSRQPDQPTYTYGTVVNLTATADPGWIFSAWSGAVSSSDNPLAVTMDGNKSITATFIQQQQGRILVDKVTDPSGSTQSFAFTLTGPELNQAFSLTGAAAPFDSGSLTPASYSVAEASVDGWTLVSATCSDGSAVDAINVEPGETVTCTFGNRQDPTALDEDPQPVGSNGVLLPMISK